MPEELRTYLDWLRRHDVEMSNSGPPRREPDHDPLIPNADRDAGRWMIEPETEIQEARDVALGLGGDHATESVLRALVESGLPRVGQTLWEVGCGTGVLAALGARRGARVVASDIDARALALAARTCAPFDAEVELREGRLLEPFAGGAQADVVVANLPHKPGVASPFLPIAQAGGAEGTELHEALAAGLPPLLKPNASVFLFLHSLPHPSLFRHYSRSFELQLVGWKRRWFAPGEYGDHMAEFEARHARGASLIFHEGGRAFLFGGTWHLKLKG